MKIGDLVKSSSNWGSRAGLIVDLIDKKCWRTHILGKAVDWGKIDPEPHAVVVTGGRKLTIPLTDLEPASENW